MALKHWIGRTIDGVAGLLKRVADDARGNVAMIFGLSMPVLVLMTVGGVDIHRASTVRVNLQDALDAAALAAARSPYTTSVDIQRVGMAALRANLKNYPNITLLEADTTFVLNSDDVVVANSKVDVKTLVANLFLPPYGKFMDDYLPVGAHSEVDRSSRNIEVALVLDITGSMSGSRIEDLREAAKDLVDLVVQDVQTPFYSKVALVPYSMGVNAGSYATAARGGVVGSVNVTNASWSTGTAKSISGITRDNPAVVTSSGHGFSNGDVVWISGVRGMTQMNNKAYIVQNKTTNTFQLKTLSGSTINSNWYSSYDRNGTVRKCQTTDCSVVITAANHGLQNNQYVYFTDVGGMRQLNDQTFLVGNRTTNTFTIDLEPDEVSAYTSGGKAWCAQGTAGRCTYFAFENVYGDLTTQKISTCVTERTGAQAYTDAAPSTAYVGRNYPGSSNPCLNATLVPLSSNRTSLKNTIDDFEAVGSTAGQIGIGWGWYMVSPNFNSLWPTSGAGAYNIGETLKAVVIMTDGEFNTPYCSGVISRDAGSGSGNNDEKIDCASDNGDPFTQGKAMCDGMKAQNIVVYTVGLGLAAGGDAANLLSYCASSPGNFYLPSSGGDLSDAFAAIGRDISKLRISK
jgi:Flp pilus assembly protein TadG